MTVLHLGHQPADLGGITADYISTNPDGFDADLDVNCIRFQEGDTFAGPFRLGVPEPSGDLRLQFRFRGPDYFSFDASNVPFVSFHDANGDLVAQLRGNTGTSSDDVAAVAVGDTEEVGGTSFGKGNDVIHWIDVKIVVGADITIEFYAGGVLQSSATAANTGAKGKPTNVVFDNQDLHGDYISKTWYYAHIAVLDGVSTIGRRFVRRTPDTVGNYDQWAGDVAALGDGHVATRMTSDSAGQRQNVTLTGPTGPGGTAVAGVHLKTIAQAGTSGPGSLAGSLRINGTDYDAAAEALPSDVPEQVIYSWSQNPNANAAWTDADLPGEIGLLSAP